MGGRRVVSVLYPFRFKLLQLFLRAVIGVQASEAAQLRQLFHGKTAVLLFQTVVFGNSALVQKIAKGDPEIFLEDCGIVIGRVSEFCRNVGNVEILAVVVGNVSDGLKEGDLLLDFMLLGKVLEIFFEQIRQQIHEGTLEEHGIKIPFVKGKVEKFADLGGVRPRV